MGASSDSDVSRSEQRAIWWNTILWTAGHSLTSGAFLSYFAVDLGASALLLGLLAAAPELVGSSGLAASTVHAWIGSRRRAWMGVTLVARVVTLCVPFVGAPWWEAWGFSRAWLLLLVVIVSQLCQGIATTLYFGWLSELTSAAHWGRLFARRNVAALLVSMTVPLCGAALRDRGKAWLTAEDLWWAYAVVFTAGGVLLLASIMPMLTVRDPAPRTMGEERRSSVWALLREPAVRWTLAHSWLLALANGLTQAAFFKYQITVVGLSLWGYFLLADVMLGVQLLTSLWAGRCQSLAEHRRALFWGSLVASAALPFWALAGHGPWWWLVGAFVCWGAFGAVNVAGPNVMFSVTPREEAVTAVALFRQVAGTLAGLSGILGGWCLDVGLKLSPGAPAEVLWPYWTLFFVSGCGRVFAALLVLGIPVTVAESSAPQRPVEKSS